MALPKTRQDGFTYADYLTWPEDERWEIIEGRAYAMTPAPKVEHQAVLAQLLYELMVAFRGKPCQVLPSPLDVLFSVPNAPDEAVETVVQPDLLVVCDPNKLNERGVRGAPDLVIEILSESTTARDFGTKLQLYEKHGVRCYIIADPWGKTLTIRTLEANNLYGKPEIFARAEKMPIPIFEGLTIDLTRVFGAA